MISVFILKLLFLFLFVDLTINMELIQIHTITRHGQRSPCFSYQTDPYKDKWKQGLCQITEEGIDQLKEFGSFLKRKYIDFIPNHFHKKDVYVRSSDTDRTIISALAAMKNIFGGEFVPIHTVPKRYDYLLKMCSICPYHNNLLTEEFRSEKYRLIIEDFESLFKELEHGTGLENVDIYLAMRICDGVTVWHQLNLSLPAWLNATTVQRCQNLAHWKFIISYGNSQLTRFRGGPLVNKIIDNMKKRVKLFLRDRSGLKMVNFFTHDSTMSAFLGHLNVFNRLQPPLASAIIVELYHAPRQQPQHVPTGNHQADFLSDFVVKFLFRNDTRETPHTLDLPACAHVASPSECRLDVFVNNLQPTFVKSIAEECGISNYNDHWMASSQFGQDEFYSNGVAKPQTSEEDRRYLVLHIVAPLLVTEIIVLWIFYRLFRR